MDIFFKRLISVFLISANLSTFLFAETWNVDSDGSWSEGTNWDSQSAPNAPTATAILDAVESSTGVYVSKSRVC